jgi:hypothetical protein
MRRRAQELVIAAFLVAASPAAAQPPALATAAAPGAAAGAPRVVAFGGDVVFGERVANDAGGLLQVLLADGTTFTLGPDAALTIDFFVREGAGGTPGVSATLDAGAVRFIGGSGAAAQNVLLKTAFGTLDLGGAIADVDLGGGAGPAHFDMIAGKEMRLLRDGRVIGRVFAPGYSIVPSGDGGRAAAVRTPPEWRGAIHRRLSGPRSALLAPQAPAAAGEVVGGTR